jgi:hypothetical protein
MVLPEGMLQTLMEGTQGPTSEDNMEIKVLGEGLM